MIPDLKIGHRLLLMPLLATVALFVVFLIAETSGVRNQRLLRSLSDRLIPALEASVALEATLDSIQRALQDAVAGEDETLLQETETSRDRFLGLIAELRVSGASDSEDLAALEDRFLRYYDLASETTLRLMFGGPTDADLVMTLESMTQSFTRLRSSLRARTQESRQAVSDAFAATVRNDRKTRLINGSYIFGSAVLLCVVSFYLARSLTGPLGDLVEVLRVSEGDTSVRARVSGGSEVAELALAFNEMMDKIGKGRSEIEAHSWLMTGLTSLGDALGSKSDLRALGDSIVGSLALHTGAVIGAIYLTEDERTFNLAGEYACAGDGGAILEFRSGEGLLGQVVANRKTLLVPKVPADHLRVSSGLGAAPPQSLLIAPIVSGDSIAGIVELGAYDEFSHQHVRFIELSGERIAVALDSLRYKLKLQASLHETRQKTRELEESQKQLAKVNRALRDKTTRLQTSNQDLEAFAYVASHDLQEPLRKIEVYAQRFEDKCDSSLEPRGREYLQRMRDASRRMRKLINDLLGFSRVSTRAEPLRQTDLGWVIQQVISDLEVPIEQTGARVEVGEMPTVLGDSAQLGQVFQNLIGNALKFARDGVAPRIKITAGRHESRAGDGSESSPHLCYEIAVEDNGIGFEEKHFSRIFEVFQRLHGRSEYEGTGIGLALCRKIVHRHGGDIQVASTPGSGSKFSIVLPVTEASEEETRETAA